MKCPYCGSERTQGTNIGARVFANICAFGAGLVGHLAGPAGGVIAERETQKSLCPYATYICLDCKKEFEKSRAH